MTDDCYYDYYAFNDYYDYYDFNNYYDCYDYYDYYLSDEQSYP